MDPRPGYVLLSLFVILAGTAAGAGHAEKASTPGETLAEYISTAIENNPGLKAAEYGWKAELARADEVSALPDPVFTYGYFIEPVETRVGPQVQRFGIRQTFPWFGTLSLRKKAALQEANARYQEYMAERARLVYRVTAAFLDYYFIGRETGITEADLELLRFWESVMRTKYAAGERTHRDLIRVQVEMDKLSDRLASLNEMKVPAAARLRAAIGTADTLDIAFPRSFDDSAPAPGPDVLRGEILEGNPDLKVIDHIIEKERANRSLASRASLPDLTVGFDYIQTGAALDPLMPESGKDPWAVTVGIKIPLWPGKNRARKDRAEAMILMQEYRLENSRNILAARAEKVIYEYGEAQRKIDLYSDRLIPRADQLLASTYAAYQAGEADFHSLVDAQRELLSLKLELERARVEKVKKLAEIGMLSGRDLLEGRESMERRKR